MRRPANKRMNRSPRNGSHEMGSAVPRPVPRRRVRSGPPDAGNTPRWRRRIPDVGPVYDDLAIHEPTESEPRPSRSSSGKRHREPAERERAEVHLEAVAPPAAAPDFEAVLSGRLARLSGHWRAQSVPTRPGSLEVVIAPSSVGPPAGCPAGATSTGTAVVMDRRRALGQATTRSPGSATPCQRGSRQPILTTTLGVRRVRR